MALVSEMLYQLAVAALFSKMKVLADYIPGKFLVSFLERPVLD